MPKKTLKTNWDLSVLYKSGNDPKIEQDLLKFESACRKFERKYKNSQLFLRNSKVLLTALIQYENIYGMVEGPRPLAYFFFSRDLNSTDQYVEAMMNKISARLTKSYNCLIFFTLSLGKMSLKLQEKSLKDRSLRHFRYFLSQIFLSAKHDLSLSEVYGAMKCGQGNQKPNIP